MTSSVRADIDFLREASADDHPYGPWVGGSKASGGRPGKPAGGGGSKLEEMRKKHPDTHFDDLPDTPQMNEALDEFDRLQGIFGADVAKVTMDNGTNWSARPNAVKLGQRGAMNIGSRSPVLKTGDMSLGQKGYIVDPTPAGVMRHEYGHIVGGTYPSRMTPAQLTEYKAAVAPFHADRLNLLGRYASETIPSEVTAEVFAAAMRPGPAKSPELARVRAAIMAAAK